MGQKVMDKEGKPVDFSKRSYDKSYMKLETYYYYLERMEDAINSKITKVTELRDNSKFKEADRIAESFIRGAVKPIKKNTVTMNRENLMQENLKAISLFKKEIFGYDTLTDDDLKKDVSDGDSKKKKSLPMPRNQKKLTK